MSRTDNLIVLSFAFRRSGFAEYDSCVLVWQRCCRSNTLCTGGLGLLAQNSNRVLSVDFTSLSGSVHLFVSLDSLAPQDCPNSQMGCTHPGTKSLVVLVTTSPQEFLLVHFQVVGLSVPKNPNRWASSFPELNQKPSRLCLDKYISFACSDSIGKTVETRERMQLSWHNLKNSTLL